MVHLCHWTVLMCVPYPCRYPSPGRPPPCPLSPTSPATTPTCPHCPLVHTSPHCHLVLHSHRSLLYMLHLSPCPPLQFHCKCTTLTALHRNYNSTTLQLQLRYTTHYIQQLWVRGEVTTATIATTPTITTPTSNHLSVNQWIRSAIRESQQPTSPIGFLFWNFRHRLVRYYWYHLHGRRMHDRIILPLAFTNMSQLRLARASATLIVVNGSVWVGGFAVSRFPVMQAADLEIWEACPLPDLAWQVPNNCYLHPHRVRLRCSKGWWLRRWPFDVHLWSCPSSFFGIHEWRPQTAWIRRCAHGDRTACKECADHAVAPLYRHHCLTTPTLQIRGLLTVMAEKAQQAAFESSAPQRDGSLIRAVRLAVAAEKAYDAPKKVNAKAIIELGHTLLRDARLQMNSPRSTVSIRPLFAPAASHIVPENALVACMPNIKCLLGPGLDAFAQGLSFCGGRGSNSLPYVSTSASPRHCWSCRACRTGRDCGRRASPPSLRWLCQAACTGWKCWYLNSKSASLCTLKAQGYQHAFCFRIYWPFLSQGSCNWYIASNSKHTHTYIYNHFLRSNPANFQVLLIH